MKDSEFNQWLNLIETRIKVIEAMIDLHSEEIRRLKQEVSYSRSNDR